MKDRFVDLHMHSTASDGTLSPKELADAVSKAGICAAALTDHDTAAGVDEFFLRCKENGVEAVSGVEISARHEHEMHILGLFFDPMNEDFASAMAYLRLQREKRNLAMIELLNKLGMEISENDIVSLKKDGVLENCGRPHFARAMVKKGYVSDISEAFSKYLAKGKPCYIERSLFSAQKSIEVIKNAGGLAVLAHPCTVGQDVEGEIKRLKEMGLEAVECYHSKHTKEFAKRMLELCRKYELLPSGGSDFHGANKAEVPIGIVCGDMHIDYKLFCDLKRGVDTQ